METPEAIQSGSTTDKSKMYVTIDPSVETGTQSQQVEPVKVETGTQLTGDEKLELEELRKNKIHFQSVADKQSAEYQKQVDEARRMVMEEKYKREMLEKTLHPPEVLTAPVEPIEPIQPADFDLLDAVDPNTPSGRYQKEYNNYVRNLAKYNKELLVYNQKQLQAESKELKSYMDSIKQEKEAKYHEQMWTGKYVEEGLSPVEANEAFNLFSSKDAASPKFHVQVYKLLKQSPVKSFTAPATITGTQTETVDKGHFFKKKDPTFLLKT